MSSISCGSIPRWSWTPDSLIRLGIRRLCSNRLSEEARRGVATDDFVRQTLSGPVAPVPEKANEQHYEAPAEFFRFALGPRLKYSCCYWPDGASSLGEAEDAALQLTCSRADIADGQDILELGCGWGSLTLWLAERYPSSRVVGISNSNSQREFIEARAAERGLTNIRILTRDMNSFEADAKFDRVISVEMFEHMRNYATLLERISNWMRPEAKLFVHVFCHRKFSYEFEAAGAGNWLGRHFFTGGLMPSADLLPAYRAPLSVRRQWAWSGRHYEQTANAWLENVDRDREAVLDVLARSYGDREAQTWLQRWRVFFMACAELWGYAGGEEWQVAHYLFEHSEAGVNSHTKPTDSAITTAA